MLHALHHLMNQRVDVVTAGTLCHGVLREVTEEGVTLWTQRGWLTITHDRIDEIRPAQPLPNLSRRKTRAKK